MKWVLVLFALAAAACAEPHREVLHWVHLDAKNDDERDRFESNRFSIVLIPEGWTSQELSATTSTEVPDMTYPELKKTRQYPSWPDTCNRLTRAFLEKEPYKSYRNFFRITRVDWPSDESGITRETGNTTQTAATAFGAYLHSDPVTKSPDRGFSFLDQARTRQKIAEATRGLQAKVVVLLVNDRKLPYDLDRGTTNMDGTPSVVTQTCNTNRSDSTIVHELGHAIALLGDEYADDGMPPYDGGEPDYRNLTKQTDITQCKWAHWVSRDHPEIKLVPGGYRCPSGCFHPSTDCCMISNYPPFCAVCTERIVQRLYEVVSLVDRVEPTLDEMKAPFPDRKPALRVQGQTVRVTCVAPLNAAGDQTSAKGEWRLGSSEDAKVVAPARFEKVGPVYEYKVERFAGSQLHFDAFDSTSQVRSGDGSDDPSSSLRGKREARGGGVHAALPSVWDWQVGYGSVDPSTLTRTSETK